MIIYAGAVLLPRFFAFSIFWILHLVSLAMISSYRAPLLHIHDYRSLREWETMKENLDERAQEPALYLIENRATVRAAAPLPLALPRCSVVELFCQVF